MRKRKQDNRQHEELFMELQREHNEMLSHYCLFRFPGDPRLRRLLYCDIVYRLWCAIDRVPTDADERKAWLYTIARNTHVDLLRRLAVQHRFFAPLVPSFDCPQPDDSLDDPFSDEQRDTLYRLIDQLGPRDRDIIFLHLEGMKDPAIARQMQMTVTAVSSRLSRIRQKLKALYENENKH